ncbi:rRNA maturation RNase YbeY [Patescibacteria group bacterium]|nr:rRNA maturation RNase YbeY [Patescibacteria group bacterium]MBU1931614.1 rRNA maturation RNase YbeY [Patescibacteria group bacterium]
MRNLIRVLIKANSGYVINRQRITQKARRAIRRFGLSGSIELGIALIGNQLMARLNYQYRQKKGPTDVLAFSLPSPKIPDKVIRLGEVVIAYPLAQKQARTNKLSLDKEIDNLVEHGVNHLLGIHHD